jgi:hypothetical protein
LQALRIARSPRVLARNVFVAGTSAAVLVLLGLLAAKVNLVVRDGFAAFYFHTFLDLDLLKETVEGIGALGYTFVDPAKL